MSVILAKPHGVGGEGQSQSNITTVAPTNTEVVDLFNTSASRTAKWIVVVTEDATSKTQAYEILALHKDGLTSTHNRSSIIGDKISHDVNVIIVGTDLTLQITNNETNDLTIDVTRLEIIN
jgi:hypothetical protein